MAHRVQAVAVNDGRLEVSWQDGGRSSYPLFWLRDHCAEGLHPQTLQRQLDTFDLPDDIGAIEASVADDGDSVRVAWDHGGAESRFAAAFLGGFARNGLSSDKAERVLWQAADIKDDLPSVAYDQIMAEAPTGLLSWLEQIERYGFCLVRGTPLTPEAFRALAEQIGYVRETIFGGIWDFTANLARADTAFTTLEIGPHTDGTYSHDAPGLQMLHCIAFEGSGGESILVDGFRAAERLRREDPSAFRLLTEVEVPGHYLEAGIHLVASGPVLRLGPDGEVIQVRFNNYDRAPFLLPPDEMKAFYRAYRTFHALLSDPAAQLLFRLTPGNALVFDNWRVLHGRKAYEGQRRVVGGYVNREDFDSKLRVLRQQTGDQDVD